MHTVTIAIFDNTSSGFLEVQTQRVELDLRKRVPFQDRSGDGAHKTEGRCVQLQPHLISPKFPVHQS